MYKALISFSGYKASMCAGEKKDLPADVAKDLLRAGYIEEISPARKSVKAEEEAVEEKKTATKTTKKRTTKK